MRLIFKQASKRELKDLDEIRAKKLHKLHLERIKRQTRGNTEYIIAYIGKEPVGHVFVNYESKRKWHECPIIEDLYVKENVREKGIAKRIMKYAEGRIKQRKFGKVGLDVETHEHWIRKFYETLGYLRVSRPHNLSYILKDNKNKKVTEKVIHLRKQL